MKCLINQDVDVQKWGHLLSASAYSSPFQSKLYFDFFNSIPDFRADVFAIESMDAYSALVVVTVQKEKGAKGYFSRRGIIYGGPLLTNAEELNYLIYETSKYYKNDLIFLESRNYKDYSNFKDVFAKHNWEYIPWLNYHLPLNDETSVKKKMSSSRWRQINKAKKAGAIWSEAKSIGDVVAFYDILSDLYMNKIKKPLHPFSFFEAFFNQNLGKFLLVYLEGKVIGGIMCPILDGKIIYEFYVCGLDNDYKDQYPSVLATWAAIEYGLNNKIPLFDFMGAGQPTEAYGVREFKSRFGGDEVEYGRFRKINNPMLYNLGKLVVNMKQKLVK